MSTIYLTDHGTKVKKNGGQIIIEKQDGDCRSLPSTYAECFVVMANAQISCEAVREILRNNGRIIYLEKNGKVLGCLGQNQNEGRKFIRQLEAYMDIGRRADIARYIVKRKIMAQKDILSSFNRRKNFSVIVDAIEQLNSYVLEVEHKNDSNQLMGVEGAAAKCYFSAWKALVDGCDFEWYGRKKHPAPDPLNSMLSFAYALLEKDVRKVIAEKGFSVTIGYLHALDYRKDSLVYDMMEPFRAMLADRYVLMCLRWQRFKQSDFEINDGKCYFTMDARNKFISGYECFVEGLKQKEDYRYSIEEFVDTVNTLIDEEDVLQEDVS